MANGGAAGRAVAGDTWLGTTAPLRRLPLAQVRTWVLWSTPWRFISWLLAVVALTAAVVVVATPEHPLEAAPLANWLGLATCGAVCIEAARRSEEPAGIVKDLLSAWTLPVALLLPPFYALLIPVPFAVLEQLRLGRSLVYRRVYSTASIALSTGAVSVLFRAYRTAAGGDALTTARAVTVLAAIGCGVVGCALNIVLIAVGVRLAAPELAWRELLGDRDQRVIDLGEVCMGVAVAGCWLASPALGLTLVVPVLLVQRGLTRAQLQTAARTDAKTGLLNAAAWQRETEREILRAQRQHQPLAVLLVDLDNFKRINDVYGHLAGDEALLCSVSALRLALRDYDQVGRFGGDEFTATLPGADVDEAALVAERLRLAVAAAPGATRATVSIGIAVLGRHGDDLTDLITAADAALYRAKTTGRNRVALAG